MTWIIRGSDRWIIRTGGWRLHKRDIVLWFDPKSIWLYIVLWFDPNQLATNLDTHTHTYRSTMHGEVEVEVEVEVEE